jgi:hypothetical protein
MAWTSPATWVTNQLVTANDLNTQVRDNLNALKNPAGSIVTLTSPISTSSTSFVEVDGVMQGAYVRGTLDAQYRPVALVWWKAGLSAASHTIKLKWLTLGGVQRYVELTPNAQFVVREVS